MTQLSALLRLWFSAVLVTGLSALAEQAVEDPFPVPAILKSNVTFWKKIYTEISLQQGIFHDADYPLIIYCTVDIGDKSGRARREALHTAEAEVVQELDNIRDKPPADWTDAEKRIKALFDQEAPPEALAEAPERIRFQQGQKERFLSGLERSGAYLDTIREVLKEYGIPQRLAFLPHVESSFDVEAYSKVGAAGVWQFMRSTGKLYLTVDYLVDERRDPVLATRAAARLLALNYQELQAWPLAITAYNYGLGGMKHAVDALGSRDIATIIERHSSRTFKFASRNFYSCFLAASDIAENPEAYFGAIGYQPKMARADVTLTHFVRPSVLARYLGVPEHELRDLNPALRPVVFQQDKLIPQGYALHVPATLAPKEVLAAMGRIPDSLQSNKPERPAYYRVRRGDNIYTIAGRLGVPAEDLAATNSISRMNRIYVGQLLNLPAKAAAKPAPAVVVAAAVVPPAAVLADNTPPTGEPADETPEESTTVPTPATPAARPPHPPSHDTLREILMTTADTTPARVASPATSAATSRARPVAMARFDVDVYGLETSLPSPGIAEIRVAVDETMGHYAEWLGVPTMRLRALNRMRRSTIRGGQALLIPLDAPDALERFNKTRLEYHLALEEDFYGRYKVADVKPYVVRHGETLWDLCNQEGGSPMWLFKKYNKQLDLGALMPGTQVWLPVIDEKTDEDLAVEQLEDGGIHPAYTEPLRGPAAAPLMLLP